MILDEGMLGPEIASDEDAAVMAVSRVTIVYIWNKYYLENFFKFWLYKKLGYKLLSSPSRSPDCGAVLEPPKGEETLKL